ncbi:TfoX/Sxy family DNA transformation protein [Dongia mobilis]|uniref:TfoX/Sxy family DNA transformation protein n=1 Tax=Dongia sp. TaxID=1977262 RepID=UPI0026EDCB18
MKTSLADHRNLGPISARRLAEVGIESEADLRALGAVAAYRRAKHAFPRQVSLNLLYALAASLAGVDWRDLSQELKAQLKAEAEAGSKKP